MKKDIIKIVAAINVHGLKIYSKTFSNIDCGKGNLLSILGKKGFTISKIKKIVSLLKREELLHREKGGTAGLFYIFNDRQTQRIY